MDQQLPVWVTVAVGVVTLVGGAVLTLWVKWKKSTIVIRSEDNKVTLEGRRAQTDLEFHIRDDAVLQWKNLADAAARRAAEAESRADHKDEECAKRMEMLVTRYREREDAMMKQAQERELQFQGIADNIRHDLGDKIDRLSKQHEEGLRENGEMKGRMAEIERQRAEDRRDIEELKTRVEAQGMRRR